MSGANYVENVEVELKDVLVRCLQDGVFRYFFVSAYLNKGLDLSSLPKQIETWTSTIFSFFYFHTQVLFKYEINYHPCMRVGNVFGHICLCVCVSVCVSVCLCFCLFRL